MLNCRSILLFSVLVSTSTACITTSSKTANQAVPDSAVVVMRSGKSAPVMSNMERSSWVNIHKQSKDASQRMQAALGAGEAKVAISEAHATLRQNPKHAGALNVLVIGYAMEMQYEKSQMYAQLYERYHGPTSTTLNARGVATLFRPNVSTGDLKQAASLFEQAFAQSGEEVAAGLNLGNLYLEIGDSKRAQEIFSAVKSRCKNCYEARLGYGIALSRNRQFTDAKAEFEGILRSQPNDTEVLYRLALVEKNGYNDINKAKKHLRKLIAEGGKDGAAYRQAYVFLQRLEGLDRKKMKSKHPAGHQEQAESILTNAESDDL
jgi:tetratricopeptide (TPR) repeat protein